MFFRDSDKVKKVQQNTVSNSVKSRQKPGSNYNLIIQRVRKNPHTLTHGDIKILQKTIGNQAVYRLMREIGLITDSSEKESVQKKLENGTGLPDDLKNGIETISGLSMEKVRVNYNSDKPAKIGASAYTQGTEIYVGPGQDKHLPHEAWHVVQQAQGRVQPTMRMSGVQINNDAGLETEADIMGDRAERITSMDKHQVHQYSSLKKADISITGNTIQRDGIGFNSRSGRIKAEETPVANLKEYELQFIIDNPDAPTIVYFPPEKKPELIAQVKARMEAIKEERLKKQTDGGLGYYHSSSRYVVAQYPQQNANVNADMKSSFSSLPFDVVEPRSPLVYTSSPPERVHTPGGSEAHLSGPYVRQTGGGFSGVAIWTANFPERLQLPVLGKPVLLSKKPVPCTVTVKESGWQEIDLDRLKRWSGEREQYKPGKSAAAGEKSDQSAAMGNISAKDAAGDAGYVDGHWEWLHLIAFTLGGINENKVNHPENLVAGTVGANRVHKVLEDTIKALIVGKHTAKVFVFAKAQILASSYHVSNKLEYKLKFEHDSSVKEFVFEINPLDMNPAQGGNMKIIEQTILARTGF